MTPNRLTPQEKQMPTIRLPLRIAVFAWADLFVLLIVSVLMIRNGNLPGFIAAVIVVGIPAVVALWFYHSHLICFDKNGFTYRNATLHIYRYRFSDISEIRESENTADLFTADRKIKVNCRAQNSDAFLALAGRKKSENTELSPNNEHKRYELGTALLFAVLGIFMCGLAYYFYINGTTRAGIHGTLYMGFVCFAGTINFIRRYFQRDDLSLPPGRYLYDREGYICNFVSTYAFIGFLFFASCGFLFPIIEKFCYPIAAVCALWLILRGLGLRYLYLCPPFLVKRVLKNHAPSPDLKAKFPQRYLDLIDESIEEPEFEYIEEEPATEDSGGDSCLLFSLLGLIVTLCLFFNVYLLDGRFEQTETETVTFTYIHYESPLFTPFEEKFGGSHILKVANKTDTEDRFEIKGLEIYGTANAEELLKDPQNEFIITFTDLDEYPEILTCETTDGKTILTEEQCRQRRKDISLLGSVACGIATAFFFLFGRYLNRKKDSGFHTASKKMDKALERFEKKIIKKLFGDHLKQSDLTDILGLFLFMLVIGSIIIVCVGGHLDKEIEVETKADLAVAETLGGTFPEEFYDIDGNRYFVNFPEAYHGNLEVFLAETERDTVFTLSGQTTKYGMSVVAIRDEHGNEYLSFEDYHTAEVRDRHRYTVILFLLTIGIFLLIVLYSYCIRNIGKMPNFIIDMILLTETPTEQFINALPEKAVSQKKHAIRKFERKTKSDIKETEE